MARPLRIEFPGALYHITSRGNARKPIFLADPDRHAFLDTLGAVVGRYRWLCHAYCLMTNHYHLLVETPEANLSRGMRQLNGVYTQRFNRRNDRVGHVLQGRFKGILVERESHLLELSRYIVLNPVRAGMTSAAEDYSWSSLRATLGIDRPPGWLSAALLTPFGSASRYLDFVREGVDADSPWKGLRGSVLGSESFVKRVGRGLGGRVTDREVPRGERLLGRERLEDLFPPRVLQDRTIRDHRIREVSQGRGYSLVEISRHLGLHYSTVSRIAAAHRRGAGSPPHEQIQDLTP